MWNVDYRVWRNVGGERGTIAVIQVDLFSYSSGTKHLFQQVSLSYHLT